MNILSCDTASEVMHLCLARTTDSGSFLYDSSATTCQNKHSELLVPRILALCSQNQMQLSDIDLLVCTNGPGSFTGLRIAMSTLKGISLALGIPLVSIPTLDAYHGCISSYPGAVLTVIDAKKKRFYCALFVDGERKTDDLDAQVEQIETLLEPYPIVLLAGSDAATLATQLSRFPERVRVAEDQGANLGLVLAKLGLKQFKETGADPLEKGPTYVRKSDAELALQQIISSLEENND